MQVRISGRRFKYSDIHQLMQLRSTLKPDKYRETQWVKRQENQATDPVSLSDLTLNSAEYTFIPDQRLSLCFDRVGAFPASNGIGGPFHPSPLNI
jgi:hypothetical protein